MNKRLNTLLFILGATMFNVIIALLSFIILMFLYARFVIPIMPEANSSLGFTFICLASLVVSVLVYRCVLKYLLKKINVEKYFDPIFVRKYKKN